MLSATLSKPAPYQAVQFEAFRVDDRRTIRLDFDGYPQLGAEFAGAGTVQAAVNAACHLCGHKEKLIIRETNEETGAALLHIFQIKQKSRPRYVYRDYQYHREFDRYADLVCVVDEGVICG